MEKKLLNEINDIRRMMGIKPKQLISEQPGRPFIERLLVGAYDDAAPVIRKFFNLADSEVDDLAAKIRQTGGRIDDDVMEVLLRSAKTDMGAVARVLRMGGYLPEIDTISLRFFDKVDEMAEITAVQRDAMVEMYKDALDQLGYISDDLKVALTKEFEQELQVKVAPKLKVAMTTIDDLTVAVEEMVTIPRSRWEKFIGADPKTITKVQYNLQKYEEAMQIAKNRGINLSNYTLEDWIKLMDDFKSNTRSLTEEQRIAYNAIYKNNSFRAWYATQNPIKKFLFWLSLIGAGPPIIVGLGYLFYKRIQGGDIELVIKAINWFEDWLQGKTRELTEKIVKQKILEDYTIDEDSFNSEYTVYVSDDKQSARVRGPQNFKVEINSEGYLETERTD